MRRQNSSHWRQSDRNQRIWLCISLGYTCLWKARESQNLRCIYSWFPHESASRKFGLNELAIELHGGEGYHATYPQEIPESSLTQEMPEPILIQDTRNTSGDPNEGENHITSRERVANTLSGALRVSRKRRLSCCRI